MILANQAKWRCDYCHLVGVDYLPNTSFSSWALGTGEIPEC